MKALKLVLVSPFILGAMLASCAVVVFAALTGFCCEVVDKGLE